MKRLPRGQEIPLYFRVGSGTLLLFCVLEVLIGNLEECVGSLKRSFSAIVSGVFAISHKAEQTFCLSSGPFRRPGGSMWTDCEEALSTMCTVLEDIDWGAALASNAKASYCRPVACIPNRFSGAKRLHGSKGYAQ